MKSKKLRNYLVILAVVLFAGCAYSRSMNAGDKAFDTGNYEVALAQYEAALKVDPNSQEAAQKARQAREMLVQEDAEAARAALAAGDLLGAMSAAHGAWERLPDSEATGALVRDVSNAVYAKVQVLTDDRDWANALMLLESMEEALPSHAERAKPIADGVRTSWIAQLREGADAAVAAGRKGDAALQFAKLTQLTSDPAYGGKRDELRKQILEEHRYLVKIRSKTSEGADRVVAGLADLGQGTALAVSTSPPKGSTPAAQAVFVVDKPKFRTDESTRTEVVSYQSGTRQVPNPFYQSRQDDVLREEKRLLEVENEVTRLESDVDRYRSDVAKEGDSPNTSTGAEQNLYNAENRLESARRNVESQRQTLLRAKEDLAREDQFREEAVYTDLQYPVKTTTLVAESVFAATITHTDDRPAIEVKLPLSTQASDESHAAQPVAGLAEDPLALPPRDQLAGELYQRSLAEAKAAIEASFDGWRESLVQRALAAGTDDERVDLLSIYLITDPSRVKPSVPADLSAFRGIPDSVKILRP